MNEQLRRYLDDMKAYLSKLPRSKKILASVLGGAIITTGAIVGMILRQDPMQVMYSDLHSEDSKAVVKKLGEKNIPYTVSDDGTTISVPESKIYQARMELAKEGIPGQDVVGFEKFDNSTLGMSNYVQRIQYIRAVQGELTRSIQRLASVKSARVHISVPPKKTFLEEEDPPKASVVLELKPGQSPTKSEVTGIAHLVASAVEGLKVNQITIVDTKGAFLHRPEDAGAPGMSTALLEMQRSIENEYEKRIEELMVPVVGFGKVRAKVTAEIDPSRSNTTEETYDADKAVPRSTVKTDEVASGQRPNPVGIPGSRSNLPGTENTNPGVPMASNNTEKNTTNTNYAIPRKISVVDKPSGTIKRLTISVVVDGYYNKGQGAQQETFTPRDENELKRLRDVAANAVGFDDTRRDSITVSCLPFKNTDVIPVEEAPKSPFDLQELSKHGVRNGLVGLIVLLFFFLVLRPFLKWSTGGDKEKDMAKGIPEILPKTVAELEAAVQAKQLPGATESAGAAAAAIAGAEATNGAAAVGPDGQPIPGTGAEAGAEGAPGAEGSAAGLPDSVLASSQEGGAAGAGGVGAPPVKPEDEELKNKILELLQSAPKKGLHIIRDWLEADDGTAFAEA